MHSRKHKHAKASLGLGTLLTLLVVGGAAAAYFLRTRRQQENVQLQEAATPINEDEMNRPNGTTRPGGVDMPGVDPLPRDSI